MSVVNLDLILIGLLGPEHRHRLREVADAIIRDLTAEEVEAMAGAYLLDGRRGAHSFLSTRLIHGRRFIRIRTASKRLRHVVEGHSFDAGCWYSVPEALGERLREEPENDMGPRIALFQVENRPPAPDDKSEEIVFLL